MNKRFLMSALLLFSLVFNLRGQQPRQQPSPRPERASTVPQKSPNGSDEDVVRITTKLVQVDVVVLTKDGKQITDLKPEDFEIFEDGRAQTIINFSYISNISDASGVSRPPPVPVSGDRNVPPFVPAPISAKEVRRTIAIVVDDLGTSFESMAGMTKQLRKFLDEQLQPSDLVAIIRTGGEVGALQQFTTDRRVLHSALENLRWNHCSRVGIKVLSNLSAVDESPHACTYTALANTIKALRFILRGMRDLPGRKSMIILSDQIPREQQELFGQNSSLKQNSRSGQSLPIQNVLDNSTNITEELLSLAEIAIRSSVVIYGIDSSGLQTTGLNAADEIPFPRARQQGPPDQDPYLRLVLSRSATLRRNREGADLIAKQTGGFMIRNSNSFELQRVLNDQQGYYLIGYRPSDETFNRRFHHIKARVKRGGLTVRTRAGFYGVTEEQARAVELSAGDPMSKALISPFGANDIPVRLTTFFVNDPTAGSLLRSFLFLDAQDLTFSAQADGTHEAAFEFSSIVFGDNGAVIDRKDKTATLRLRGAPYARVMKEGVVYGFDTPVKEPGTFQFRVAVRDKTSSRIGAAGQFAEIPNLGNDRLTLSGIVVRNDANPATVGDDEITRDPAVRRFRQGSTLIFAYEVYNARLDKTTGLPQVKARTHIFRDGKPIFTGDPLALDVTGQPDLKRLNGAARFQLGPELSPGQYVLQIIADDNLAKEKQRTATQWIDFEVVK